MKKVAYVYNQRFQRSYAGTSVAQGFESAFNRLGFEFKFFDLTLLKLNLLTQQKRALLDFEPDLIFTSVENIHYLPLDELRPCSLVLWGQFYKPCNYEKQIVTISSQTKNRLVANRDKHRILIWSQHSNDINEQFFSGYQSELGLEFVQLLHCAEKSQWIEPILETPYDFIWIGNISHRKDIYNDIIVPLKKASRSFVQYTEHNPISPKKIHENKCYSNALISINVHTKAQLQYNILLNERVFSSSLQGGFQICDNSVARQYFTKDELLIADKPSDYLDLLFYYKKAPEKRLDMIQRMQKKILSAHLYEHRIKEILNLLYPKN